MLHPREIPGLLREAFHQWWFEDNIFQLGAALSYYAVFAVSPLVVLVVAMASLAYGEEEARGELENQIEHMAGPTIAEAVSDLAKEARASGRGPVATGVSMILLAVGAAGFFAQLQHSLNYIWGVRVRAGRGWWHVLHDRLWTFLMVLVIGLLLLTALLFSTTLGHIERQLPDTPERHLAWRVLQWLVSLGLLTLLFGIMYKALPDVRFGWRVVWLGAAVTAVLFTLGNYLIGLYLASTSTASAYGAAGSLAVVLAWVYYSSQVVLFGAEVTEACAKRFHELVVPTVISEPDPHRGSPAVTGN